MRKRSKDSEQRIYKEKKGFKNWIGILIFFSIILIILGAITIHLNRIKSSYKREIAKAKRSSFSFILSSPKIKKTIDQRVEFLKTSFFLNYPLKYSYSMSDFIRALNLVTLEDIELKKLKIEPDFQKFNFSLLGELKSNKHKNIKSRLIEFLNKIEEFDNVIQASLSKFDINKKSPNFYIYGQVDVE